MLGVYNMASVGAAHVVQSVLPIGHLLTSHHHQLQATQSHWFSREQTDRTQYLRATGQHLCTVRSAHSNTAVHLLCLGLMPL